MKMVTQMMKMTLIFWCNFITVGAYLSLTTTSASLLLLPATGKVLALELPKNGNDKCTVLYPASAKASTDIEISLCPGLEG
uniref:Methylcobalamin:com methyltransferase n=1 Tax=Solanum tuberosum TaxID=4113 RepID=M1CYW4_SOLTU